MRLPVLHRYRRARSRRSKVFPTLVQAIEPADAPVDFLQHLLPGRLRSESCQVVDELADRLPRTWLPVRAVRSSGKSATPPKGAQVLVDQRMLLVARALVLAAQAEGYWSAATSKPALLASRHGLHNGHRPPQSALSASRDGAIGSHPGMRRLANQYGRQSDVQVARSSGAVSQVRRILICGKSCMCSH